MSVTTSFVPLSPRPTRALPDSSLRHLLDGLADQSQEVIETCLDFFDDSMLSEVAICTYRDQAQFGPHSQALDLALAHACSSRMRRCDEAPGVAARPGPARGARAWLSQFYRRNAVRQHVETVHKEKCRTHYLPNPLAVPIANTALLVAIDALEQAAPAHRGLDTLRPR